MRLKIIRIIALALLLNSCVKQDTTFSISGKVIGIEDGKAFVVTKALSSKKRDTIAVGELKNGNLSIVGHTEVPKLAHIKFEKNPDFNNFEMVLENEIYSVEANIDISYFPIILGGNYHQNIFRSKNLDQNYYGYLIHHSYYNLNYTLFENQNDTVRSQEQAVKSRAVWRQAYQRSRQVSKALFASTDDALLKALILEDKGFPIFMKDLNQSIIDDICADLEQYPFHKEIISTLYKEYSERNQAVERTAKGQKFVDFAAFDKENNPVKLSEVVKKNKVVMLEFWASWCGPCRAEIPNLKKAYQKYKKHGFEIYSISIDTKIEDWHKLIKEEQLPWVSCIQKIGTKEVEKKYGITGVPASYLIHKDGTILNSGRELRGHKLEPILENLLLEK